MSPIGFLRWKLRKNARVSRQTVAKKSCVQRGKENANCAPQLRLLQYHCTYPLTVGTVSQTSALYYRLRCRHSRTGATDQSYFRGSGGTCLRHRSEQHLVFRRLLFTLHCCSTARQYVSLCLPCMRHMRHLTSPEPLQLTS